MKIDPEKQKRFKEYLDDILPSDPSTPPPADKFHMSEIVKHPEYGLGIITGFRIKDFDREFEGLGVQFVNEGTMMEHKVFTPDEALGLTGSGILYLVKKHAGMTLEAVWDCESKIPKAIMLIDDPMDEQGKEV